VASWVHRWLVRHQHPASRVFHAFAIPMLPLAGYLAIVQLRDAAWSLWWRPVALVVLSYALQWIGHRIEGNDMGELILAKKWIGKPYVAISPRYEQTTQMPPSPRTCQPGWPTSSGGGERDDHGQDADRKSSTPPGPKDLGHPSSSSKACSP